jgi:hypothetical protein
MQTLKTGSAWQLAGPVHENGQLLTTQCYTELRVCYHGQATLQRHNTENSKQIFPGKELRGYSPNSYIFVSVSNLYIPLIGLPILLQENRWADPVNI